MPSEQEQRPGRKCFFSFNEKTLRDFKILINKLSKKNNTTRSENHIYLHLNKAIEEYLRSGKHKTENREKAHHKKGGYCYFLFNDVGQKLKNYIKKHGGTTDFHIDMAMLFYIRTHDDFNGK